MNFDEVLNKLLTQEVLGYVILALIFIFVYRWMKKTGGIMFLLFIVGVVIIGCGILFPGLIDTGKAYISGSWMGNIN